MSIIILQKRSKNGHGGAQTLLPDGVQVTISHSEKQKRRDGRPYVFLRCVFGKNIPFGEYYTLGKDGEKIVIIPASKEVGFKVGKTTHSGYGAFRINLTDDTIKLLPIEWQDKLRDGDIEFNAVFDYEGKRVLLNGIQN